MAVKLSSNAATRIALRAQGLLRPTTGDSTGPRHFARVMATLGVVQLDSVNVCVRSHYMPFYSRLGVYKHSDLDTWLNTPGRHFEYWAHAACVLPVTEYPLWRWKMEAWQPSKKVLRAMTQHPKLVDQVIQQVNDQGSLSIRELQAPKARNDPWWGYGPGKLVLETLFGQGKLSALRGENFTRRYYLPQNLIPQEHYLDRRYDERSACKVLLQRAARHYGIATEKDLADYYRLKLQAVRPLLEELTAEGELERVQVAGWNAPAYKHPAARQPRAVHGGTLLSPFDPLVWYRDRALRLFDFHYRIEIYTPKEQRKHGYYVLPFLLDGELVARVDAKANRKTETLEVPSAFVELGKDDAHVARALATELQRFASWLGLQNIQLGQQGNLMRELRRQS